MWAVDALPSQEERETTKKEEETEILPSVRWAIEHILFDEEVKKDAFLDIVSESLPTVFMNLSPNFRFGQQSIVWVGNFEIRKDVNKLRIDRIQTPWYWKIVMFYIIACAINHNLKEIELKAEPIWPEEKRKTLEKLIDFYSSFWFRKIENLTNGVRMNLQLNDENITFLLKKLYEFVK